MKQKKSKLTAVPKPLKAPAELPKDLSAQLESLRAFVRLGNLLNEGAFQASAHDAVKSSIAFVQAIHAHALEIAVKHPKADLSPDLLSYKKSLVGTSNGQA